MQDVISTATGLFDRWRQYLSLRSEAEALVRLVAIECRRNLALLSALRLSEVSDQADPDFLAIAALLETEAMESLFAIGPKENRARDLLSQRVSRASDPSSQDDDLPSELILRIYVRITAMQKLLKLERAGKGLRNIRWRTRLLNAEADLREATQGLDRALSDRK